MENVKVKTTWLLTIVTVLAAVGLSTLILLLPKKAESGVGGGITGAEAISAAATTDNTEYVDMNFLSDQSPTVDFKINAPVTLTNKNLKNYVKVTDFNGNEIDVTVKNNIVIHPDDGYAEGYTYYIYVMNGAKLDINNFENKEKIAFSIKQPETFVADFATNTYQVEDADFISYDGAKLKIKKGNYKAGDVLIFNNIIGTAKEPMAIKVVSVSNFSGITEIKTSEPSTAELYKSLSIAQTYKLNEKDIIIDEEAIEEAILDEPIFDSLADTLKVIPKITIKTTNQDGKFTLDIEIRINLSAVANAISNGEFNDKEGWFDNGGIDVNTYLVFKIKYENETEITNGLDAETAQYSVTTRESIKTVFGVYLEIDGVIQPEIGKVEKEAIVDSRISKLIEELEKLGTGHNEIKKDITVARFYASYMKIVGIGGEFNLKLGINFKGRLGVDYTTVTTTEHKVFGQKGNENEEDIDDSVSNTNSQTLNGFQFSLMGTFEARFGVELKVYVDVLVIFKASISAEAGIYIKGGGVLVYQSGTLYESENGGEIFSDIDKDLYKTAFFEIGVYWKVQAKIELNLIIYSHTKTFPIAGNEYILVRWGDETIENLSIMGEGVDENYSYVMKGTAQDVIPSIWVTTYDMFKNDVAILDTDDYTKDISNGKIVYNITMGSGAKEKRYEVEIEWNPSEIIYDASTNSFIPANRTPGYHAEYLIDVRLKDKSSIWTGIAVDFIREIFGIEVATYDKILVEKTIKFIQAPIDLEDYEIRTTDNLGTNIKIGSSTVLYATGFYPATASFYDVKFELMSSINGVSCENGLLSVGKNVSEGEEIIIKATTVKNEGV